MRARRILVTGATGKQGGALAVRLLERGHEVVATTRRPDSREAGRLEALGARIVKADFDDLDSLKKAIQGVETLFAMSTPYESGSETERRQGVALVDAAREVGVDHFVFTSVAGADRRTRIPHFDSKLQIERHLRESGLPYTVIAPVFFMENLLAPAVLNDLRSGRLALPLPASRKLQMVAVADIGSFATAVIEQRGSFLSKRYELASDELTGAQMADVLGHHAGRRIAYVEVPVAAVRARSEDQAAMWEWFDRVGYSVEILYLQRNFPELGWHSFDAWLRTQDLSALRAQPTAGSLQPA